MRFVLVPLLSVFLAGGPVLPAQSTSTQKPKAKKKVTLNDAKVYREAMVWFKKAEAMIGTPKENSDEQMQLFQKAIQIMPDFLEAHYNLGLIYGSRNMMREAVAEFEKVLQLEPKFDPGIYFLLASSYQELGDTGRAITALQEGLRRKPGEVKSLKALAYLQFNNREENAAIRTLQQLLEIDPGDVSSRVELAQLLQRKGEIDQASIHYEDALRGDPANFTARNNLGIIYLQQKKYSDAVAQFEAANQAKPGTPELLEMLGDAFAFQEMHAKAVAAYKSALEKAPERAVIHAKLGFSLANARRTAEAANALENAVRLNPNNSDAFFLLGDLYEELKRPEDAIAAYKRSIEIDPKRKEVHYNLGTLYAEQKQLDNALSELKAAVQLGPDYSPAWANLALVAEKLELDQEAIQANEKVIALEKGQAVHHFHLGILYAKTNQPDASIAAFTRAIELEPDRYRPILREELKKVHSVLDSVRYKESFTRLLGSDQPK